MYVNTRGGEQIAFTWGHRTRLVPSWPADASHRIECAMALVVLQNLENPGMSVEVSETPDGINCNDMPDRTRHE